MLVKRTEHIFKFPQFFLQSLQPPNAALAFYKYAPYLIIYYIDIQMYRDCHVESHDENKYIPTSLINVHYK